MDSLGGMVCDLLCAAWCGKRQGNIILGWGDIYIYITLNPKFYVSFEIWVLSVSE